MGKAPLRPALKNTKIQRSASPSVELSCADSPGRSRALPVLNNAVAINRKGHSSRIDGAPQAHTPMRAGREFKEAAAESAGSVYAVLRLRFPAAAEVPGYLSGGL